MKRTIYLDHSASTPVDPRVMEEMIPYFTDHYGNSSSSHRQGRKAEAAIENARETVAEILNCKPSEIVFTSGGSESDNLGIRGVAWPRRSEGYSQLVTTPVDHSAVIKTIEQLSQIMGYTHALLPVDRYGLVKAATYADFLSQQTAIVSIIYANNEVGTISPIADLSAEAHKYGILFHSDAVQAAGQLSLAVNELGVDLLSISAHKFYGPKGVGALYCREGIELVSHTTGGSHENYHRAGTHNTPGIVGLASALSLAYAERDQRNAHYRALRDYLISEILTTIPGSYLTGHPEKRLPSHASFVFEGVDSSQLLMHLDMNGISASGGSACKTGNPEPSGVLLAMGYPPELAISSLRLSVGQFTTEADVVQTVDILGSIIDRLRKLRAVLSI